MLPGLVGDPCRPEVSSARADGARSAAAGPARLLQAWRQLTPEQRLAAIAAFCLFLTLFLPWYQEHVIAASTAKGTNLVLKGESLTGWAAFSFVEAAVLLVAMGVQVLLFERAEGRAFHLPGGDGTVITAAGAWTCILVIWRIFDKEGTSSHAVYASTSGIEWGIFVALGLAGLLTYAGTRMRAAHRPEPPLPTEDGAVFDGRWHRPGDEHGGPARGPAAGEDASARHARRAAARASSSPAEPVAHAPTGTHAQPDPEQRAENAAEPGAQLEPGPDQPRAPRERVAERSSWRPAEKPEWSEPERKLGWLTAPPGSRARPAAGRSQDSTPPPQPSVPKPGEDPTNPLAPTPGEDWTIPFAAKPGEDPTNPLAAKPGEDRTIPLTRKPDEDWTIPFAAKPGEDRTIPLTRKPDEDRTIPLDNDDA